ncbi:MAG TPA: RebB family R body protein [Acidobacteriaceae bacterium]|nr:RebB family R body protein [Acidobacteriaceae bacterium]
MAEEGTVNSQITDSVTQAIAAVVGNAPSETKGLLDTLMAETVGMAMYNAVTNQHNAQMVSNAAVTAACARMLRTPFASSLPVKLSHPLITGVSPNPIPLSAASQCVQVNGSGFDQALSVDLFDAGGRKLATFSGSMQIANWTPFSFMMSTNVFNIEGAYSMQIHNPDGGVSALEPLVVQAQPPVITAVNSSGGAAFQVTGANFQSGLTAVLQDPTGKTVAGVTVAGITAAGFNLNLPQEYPAGPYSLLVTNPDGRTASRLFAGPAKASVAAVSPPAEQPAASHDSPCPPPGGNN